jgi:nucleoside-diphosphate-sugar epimerase
LVGDGNSWSNRIHVDDLARIIAAALEIVDLPPVLCVSDDEPARACDVVRFVCEREGLPMPGFVSEEDTLRAGAFTMLSNQRVKNDRMKQVLGISLLYPTYREGFYPIK